METQLTNQEKASVYRAIQRDGIEDLLSHTKKISVLTKGRSGFFGVSFPVLIPFLERLRQSQLELN